MKCCLMYEYDVYADARRTIPRLREPLQTLDGEWFLVKIDPLAGTMSFSTSKGSMANLTTLPISRVREIIALNRAGEKAETLIGDGDETTVAEPTYRSEEDSITRFDNKNKRNKRNKRRGSKEGKPEAKEEATMEVAKSAEAEVKSEPKSEAKEGGETPHSEHRRSRNNRRERDNREGREQREGRDNREKRERHTEGDKHEASAPQPEGDAATSNERPERPERGERGERRGRNYRGRRHGGERRNNGGENNNNNSNNE